jgi:hypothetical protein
VSNQSIQPGLFGGETIIKSKRKPPNTSFSARCYLQLKAIVEAVDKDESILQIELDRAKMLVKEKNNAKRTN